MGIYILLFIVLHLYNVSFNAVKALLPVVAGHIGF